MASGDTWRAKIAIVESLIEVRYGFPATIVDGVAEPDDMNVLWTVYVIFRLSRGTSGVDAVGFREEFGLQPTKAQAREAKEHLLWEALAWVASFGPDSEEMQ